MYHIVVAADENNAIGKDNQLLWHLPIDLKFFKQITTGHTVIMGRKTYDSVGKPLLNRRNIVISRQANLQIPGCEVVSSVQQAIELTSEQDRNDQDIFIVGGAEIYRQTLSLCDRIYLTRVHHRFDADTHFPELDANIWKLISREDHPQDQKHKYAFSFLVYEKV